MTLDLRFPCPLASGLHARPASRLAEIARGFVSACVVTNTRTGAQADAKSVLAVLAADVGAGDVCLVRVDGADAHEARAALQRFVERELPRYDDPPTPVTTEADLLLPRALATSGAPQWRGLAVSPGVGIGQVVHASGAIVRPEDVDAPGPVDPGVERQAVTRAIDVVRARIDGRLRHRSSEAEAAILAAHVAIVTDPLLRSTIAD
ncbi:MAG TPA: HPr family phosphocarrier protein, partial [Gammaproteobacteria bacterium]|nr:HPr family phosphocarrier protein [Gammaproteobacteria bacterium]